MAAATYVHVFLHGDALLVVELLGDALLVDGRQLTLLLHAFLLQRLVRLLEALYEYKIQRRVTRMKRGETYVLVPNATTLKHT